VSSYFRRFYSTPEVLEVTGLSKRRLYYWIEKGYLESEYQQPKGSGSRWSFPYIDVLKLDLVGYLSTNGIELPVAFASITALNEQDLPFEDLSLTTYPTDGWTITPSTDLLDAQLLRITIDLTIAVQDLNTRITNLNQGVLPF